MQNSTLFFGIRTLYCNLQGKSVTLGSTLLRATRRNAVGLQFSKMLVFSNYNFCVNSYSVFDWQAHMKSNPVSVHVAAATDLRIA